ncbi:MAG: hypothetical protein WBG46_11230 [Nonlabens sp.]
MKPYKLSPTQGVVPVDKIVGRKKELAQLEKKLASQSVVIEEIRRMGKTLFLKKFAHQANDRLNIVYFTLQGVKDVNELIEMLIEGLRIERSFAKFRIGWNKIKSVVNAIKPDEVDVVSFKFKLPIWKEEWKPLLNACLEDIAYRENDDEKPLVIILDELPIMIWDWIQRGESEKAKEFLDVLRKNRQLLEDKGRVRFVICGSIGMEVVLQKLKKEHKYTGEPFNDAAPFSLGAMTKEDAEFLSSCLLLDDFKVADGENEDKVIKHISDVTEGLPFYIHRIFSIIRDKFDSRLSMESVNTAYKFLIEDPFYSKVLKQLDERLDTYYPVKEAETFKSILNLISKSDDLVSEKEIAEKLNLEKKTVKSSIYTLLSDTYLIRDIEDQKNYYSFKYKLVKKWWRINMA